MIMKTKVSKLRAKLSRYLKAVRAGQEVVVHDRDTPIARLVPYAVHDRAESYLLSRPKDPGAPRLGDMKVRGIPYRGTDSLALLAEDRARR